MIEDTFDKTFTVYRQSWSNDKSTEEKIGTFDGHKQQTDPRLEEYLDETLTQPETIYCGINTDVQEGDRLEDSDSRSYDVRNLRKLDYGDNQHIRLIVERAED